MIVEGETRFYEVLEDPLKHYSIDVVPPSPKQFALASSLRSRYGLSYFDSLHAAAAIIIDDVL